MAKNEQEDQALTNVGIDSDTYAAVKSYRDSLVGNPPIRRVVQALILEGLSSLGKRKR